MKSLARTISLFTIICLITNLKSYAQNGMRFDGIDDYSSVPNGSAEIAGLNTISLSFWVKPNNSSPAYPDFDGMAGFRNGIDADFYILQLSATSVEARFRNSSGTNFDIVGTGLILNSWNHFVMTYDGTTLSLYHNGMSAGTTAANGTITSTTTPFDMGYLIFGGNNFYLDGELDRVALWDKTLSPAEVTALYNAPCELNPSDINLKLAFEFNQGISGGDNTSITSVLNSKGTNHATINNITLNGTTSNFMTGIPGLTKSTLSISSCGSYTSPSGNYTYSTTGTYEDTIPNSAGCDSLITIDLSVTTIDNSISNSSDTLTAAQDTASYQWMDCNTQTLIAGATNQTFIPTTNGNYAAIITMNGCSDTSACESVITLSLNENNLGKTTTHPNPFTDNFTLTFPKTIKTIDLTISDITGRTVKSEQFKNKNALNISLINEPSGIYFVQIHSEKNNQTLKMLKK